MIWFYLIAIILYIISYWIAKNLREDGKSIFSRATAILILMLSLIPVAGTFIIGIFLIVLLCTLCFGEGITWKDNKTNKIQEWLSKSL